MKVLVAATTCGLLGAASMAAHAQYALGPPPPPFNGFYFGASAGEAFYREDGIPSLNPTVALFRVGQQFSPYVAIEGRAGGTVAGGYDDGFHADLDLIYAGYVKGILPVSPWFSFYALGGLGGAQIHRNYPDFNTNDIALSYGGGGELNVGGGASIDVEWTHLNNGNNIGYNYNSSLLLFGVNWHPYW
jgi:opacity protein-like surface antigen